MGTNTFAVLPTMTLKKGSGGGNYSSSSASYVDVDATNLAYTVTIPTGWKLSITASFQVFPVTGAITQFVSLLDGSTLVEATILATTSTIIPGSLNWVITGNGASHAIKLQFKTSNVADAITMVNSSATATPTMLFILTPSN